MSPYEHQPIIFNYGLQSKVISCPLCSTPDGPVSAGMIWCPPACAALATAPTVTQKGNQKYSIALIATYKLRWAEKKSPPFVTVLLQIQGEYDINRKVFTGSG